MSGFDLQKEKIVAITIRVNLYFTGEEITRQGSGEIVSLKKFFNNNTLRTKQSPTRFFQYYR